MSQDHVSRRRFSDQERQAWICRYRASGLAQEEFARRQGLSVGTLRNWLYRFENGASSPQAPEPIRLQEVRVIGGSDTIAWAAEVRLPGGASCRLSGGADPRWVGAIIDQLRRVC